MVEAIPAHVGLGSGTKLALAVAQALAALHGRTVDAPGLAEAVGRAARSAVGTWTFALGGLVVEGGVRRGEERPAPLLARYAVPEEWRVVLVVPSAEPGLSGAAEVEAFGRLVPSAERSAAIAQLVLTSLLPALVERDLEEFGAALTRDPAARRRLVRRPSRAVASTRARARSSRRSCAAGRPAPARARGGRRSTGSWAARPPDASSHATWRL